MPLDKQQTKDLRDRIEADVIAPALESGFRRFLARIEKAALSALDSPQAALTAGAGQLPTPEPFSPPADIFTLGTVLGWWAEEVGASVGPAVLAAIDLSYISREGTVITSGTEGAADYLANVIDRLVHGKPVHGVTAPVDAFDTIRRTLAESQALSWSRPELARRISHELAWTAPDHDYWRNVRDHASNRLDDLLDPLGPPGTPAREWARLNDPRVAALQRERSTAVLRLDADRSVWETRATMIARTESTGVANYSALHALAAEGAVAKEWIAAHDARTREEHAAADGQIVTLDKPFDVGGHHLQFPGDPSAPAHLVINCRCTIVGVYPEDLPEGFEVADDTPPAPETFSADEMRDMGEDELEALMERSMAAGDYDTAERAGEELDGRFYTDTGTRIRHDDPFDPDIYEWFEAQTPEIQDEFLVGIDAAGRGSSITNSSTFLEEQWSYLNGGKKARATLPPERVIRQEYHAWLDMEWVKAEEATRGSMLSPRARALGVHPEQLWKVNERTARAWASEEMLAYWDDHGRMTFRDFKAGYTGTGSSLSEKAGTWLQ